MGVVKPRAHASWSYPSWTNPHLRPEVIDRERGRLPDEVFRQEFGAEFIGYGIPRCQTCKFPVRDYMGYIRVYGDEEEPECPDCGRPVDHEGLTLDAMLPDGIIYPGKVLRLLKVPRNVQPPRPRREKKR